MLWKGLFLSFSGHYFKFHTSVKLLDFRLCAIFLPEKCIIKKDAFFNQKLLFSEWLILVIVCSLANQQVKSLETEISGYKRSIQKEEEKNETLTVMLNKAESDKTVTKKKIKISVSKQDALKQQYATYSRTLHETEQFYNKATTVSYYQSKLYLMLLYYLIIASLSLNIIFAFKNCYFTWINFVGAYKLILNKCLLLLWNREFRFYLLV